MVILQNKFQCKELEEPKGPKGIRAQGSWLGVQGLGLIV